MYLSVFMYLISIFIVDSPKETTLSTAVTVSTGSDITITCKAHGVPLPRYNFFFNNKTINDTEAERSGVLTLTAVSFDQSGVYSCTPEYAKGRGVKKEVTVYIRRKYIKEACTSLLSLYFNGRILQPLHSSDND